MQEKIQLNKSDFDIFYEELYLDETQNFLDARKKIEEDDIQIDLNRVPLGNYRINNNSLIDGNKYYIYCSRNEWGIGKPIIENNVIQFPFNDGKILLRMIDFMFEISVSGIDMDAQKNMIDFGDFE